MGDTKTPVIFLIISTGINAVLDPIFISKLGLNGAALASLISGIVAVIAALIYLQKKKFEISLIPKRIKFDKSISLEILKIGMPSVITGQNIGAGKINRVKEVFKWGIIMNFIFICAVAVLVMIFSKEILLIFALDSKGLSIGSTYLRINAVGYCIFSISYITNGIITGSGKTIVTMMISIISLILIRVPLSNLMSKTSLGLNGIWYAILITYGVTTICSVGYYLSGRYRKEKIMS